MNKYVKRYRKIVDELIKKSFPSLKGKKIIIEELPSSVTYTGFAIRLIFTRKLKLHIRTRAYSNKLLEGIIAHELCHLEDWEINGLGNYLIHMVKSIFSKKYFISNERRTDRIAIEKGYARQLYAQRKLRLEEARRDVKSMELLNNYLSPEEIKSYAKKIGK